MTANLTLPYFYRPLAFYNGRVLKCAGIATTGNIDHLNAEHPGGVVLEGYRGDRIDAATHKPIS
jgi:hypothetical protein